MAGLIVLDAGALIALCDANDAHHRWARGMFIDTVGGDLSLSCLTYAEVLVHPTKAGKAQEFEHIIAGLHLEIHAIDAGDSRDLGALRATTALTMPEVLVLHLALGQGATLATTDKALAAEAKKHALVVRSPS